MPRKKKRQPPVSRPRSATHTEHLEAREDHSVWLKDLQRWRSEYDEAVRSFARRMLSELELANFEDALERHEAAIQAHEELVDRHEWTILRQAQGSPGAADEFEDLHRQMHDRHELSRREHEQLQRTHRAILNAIAMMAKSSPGS